MNVREWALPVYTILMQLPTGTLLVLWAQRSFLLRELDERSQDRIFLKPLIIVLVSIVTAIIGAHFHLSEPLLSFMAVFNLGRSWLSREILFTVLMLVGVVFLMELILNHTGRKGLKTALGWLAVFAGMASVYSMSNIYLIPAQTPWNNIATLVSFLGTVLLLGAVTTVALLVMDSVFTRRREPELQAVRTGLLRRSLPVLTVLAATAAVLILVANLHQVDMLRGGDEPAKISLILLFDLYYPLLVVRYLSLFTAVAMLAVAAYRVVKRGLPPPVLVKPAYLALFLAMVAEIMGRFLFYATHVRAGL